MWGGATDQLLVAVRQNLSITATATHRNLVTGVTTDLPVVDGAVTDDATSNVRRSLTLTLTGEQWVFDVLNTQGGEITITQTVTYTDQTTTTVIPQGVFIVDSEQLDYSPMGNITLTAPDRWLKVQRNRFGLSRASVPTNMAWQEIQRLVEGAWPRPAPSTGPPGPVYPFPGWSRLDTSATTKVGSIMWDNGDREAAILSLCQANSLEIFFDRTGKCVLQPVPVLTPASAPVWTVDAGESGVLTAATRVRDRSNLRNAIIVSTSATDVVFDPVLVSDTTAGDPLNTTGPLGFVPEEWSSPSLRNSAQASAAGLTRLRKRLGAAQTVSLSAVGNPALDSNDVISVLYPQIDPSTPAFTDLQILDSVTQPLLETGTQDMQTRSTRPATDGGP